MTRKSKSRSNSFFVVHPITARSNPGHGSEQSDYSYIKSAPRPQNRRAGAFVGVVRCFFFCVLRQRGRHRQTAMCAPSVFTIGQPSHGHGSSSCFFCSRVSHGLAFSYESDTKINRLFHPKKKQGTGAAHIKTQKLKDDSLMKKYELNMNLHLRPHP